MKLEIELVPTCSWGVNLRDVLAAYTWQKVSKKIQEQSGFRCEICERVKGEGITRLNCHEVWDYNFSTHIQTLVGLQALCFECHAAKHIGFAKTQDWIDTDKIIAHFLNVNNITYREYKDHEASAYELWSKRNQVEWSVDFGEWTYIIDESKEKKTPQQLKQEKINAITEILRLEPSASNKRIYEILPQKIDIEVSWDRLKKYAAEVRKSMNINKR